MIAATVRSLDLSCPVVAGHPVGRSAQERERRLCLEALLRALSPSVEQVWLEARTDRLNRRDEDFVLALRTKRAIPTSMRVDVGRPDKEPMSWIADALAGAGAAAAVGERGWLDEFGEVTMQAMTLR